MNERGRRWRNEGGRNTANKDEETFVRKRERKKRERQLKTSRRWSKGEQVVLVTVNKSVCVCVC